MSFFTALKPEIRKGRIRVVWVFPKLGFALKFPIIRIWIFLRALSHCFRTDMKTSLGMLKMYCSGTVETELLFKWHLFAGIVGNWREFVFSCKHRHNTFLLPTHFSFLGLCNVMPLGNEISEDIDFYGRIYDATDGDSHNDGHHFTENRNFCIYKGRLCLRDYGGIETQKILLRHFPKLNALTSEDVT